MGFSGGGGGLSTLQSSQLTNNNRILLEQALANIKNANNLEAGLVYPTEDGVTSTNGTSAGTGKFGMKILTKTLPIKIKKLKKHSTSDSTKAYILDSSKNVLATSNFIGDFAYFSYQLLANTTYYLATDKNGASGTHIKDTGIGYPQVKTYFNWTGGLNNGSDYGSEFYDFNVTQAVHFSFNNLDFQSFRNIICDVFSFANGFLDSVNTGSTTATFSTNSYTNASGTHIVQINAKALSFSPSYFMVLAEGSGSVNCDISFDNGSHYQTGVALNTITAITNVGSNMILKLNLTGVASVSNYSVIFF